MNKNKKRRQKVSNHPAGNPEEGGDRPNNISTCAGYTLAGEGKREICGLRREKSRRGGGGRGENNIPVSR